MHIPKYLEQLKADWVYPLRRKLIIGTILAVGLPTTLLGVLLYRYQYQDATQKTNELTATIISGLKHSMVDEDPGAVQATLENIVKAGYSVRHIFIVDPNGDVVFSSNRDEVGRHLNPITDPTCQQCHLKPPSERTAPSITVRVNHQTVQRTAHPLQNEPACYNCHDASIRKLGMLIVDRSLRKTYDLIFRTLAFFVLFGCAGIIAMAVLVIRGTNQYIRTIVNQSEELISLYVMVERLSRSIDRNELDTIVLEILHELFKPGAVDMIFPKDGSYRCVSWPESGGHPERKKIESDPDLQKAFSRWISEPGYEPEVGPEGRELIIPVTRDDTRLVLIRATGLAEPFSVERLWLLRTMSDHFAAAYENARLYSIAITDKLTSIYTRRHFEYSIQKVMTEAEATKDPVSLIMMDVDNFKHLNDRYGHPTGDAALAALGTQLLERIRSLDLAFRYGGEEFMILLPRTTSVDAAQVGKRLLQIDPVTSVRGEVVPFTVSMGIATWPEHAATVTTLIEAADQAMYAAKRAGKNRFVVASTGSQVE